MCSAPKAPEVQDIAMRSMPIMPDNGDPAVRQNLRRRRNLGTSASVLAPFSQSGSPSTTATSGA